jgi:hypothetical protein
MLFTVNEKGLIVPVEGDVPRNVVEKRFTLAHDMGRAHAGEVVTMAVTPSDVAQVTELETYLGGYSQDGYVADMVSRLVPVDKEESKRRNHAVTNAFEPVADDVGRDGAINQIEHASELVTFKTSEHALAAWIPWATERESTYPIRQAHSTMISDKLKLNREIAILGALASTANWVSGHYTTITTNYRWSTGSTKDPVKDLMTYINASWQRVTDIVMEIEVAHYLLKNTDVVARVTRAYGDTAAREVLEALGTKEVQRVVIPGLPPITIIQSKKYVGSTMSSILADDVVGLNIPSTLMGGETMATHLTFRYNGRSGTGYTVNEYVPWGRGLNGGTMLEAGYSEHRAMVSGRAGFLLKSVLTGT